MTASPASPVVPEVVSARASMAGDARCLFLLRLHAVLHQIALHPLEDPRLPQALHKLQESVQDALAHNGHIEVRLSSRGMCVNGDVLQVDVQTHVALEALGCILQRHQLGGLSVHPGADITDWQALVAALSQQAAENLRFAALQQLLHQHGAEHLELEAAARPARRDEARSLAEAAYRDAVVAAEDVLAATSGVQPASLRALKRAVQRIVDQVQSNESALLGMRTLQGIGSGLAVHSTNVALLSIVLGRRLGLDRNKLYELGLCGVLHDIGKQRLDPAVLASHGPLSEADWQEIKRHPREGLVLLQGMLQSAESSGRPLLASYEHHMKVDQTGYPRVRRQRKVTLFSRIVSVVDVFDAVTSSRSYRSRPWCPDVVLRNMLDQPRWGLDRAIVKALIHAVGLHPIGSLVQLSDGHPAVVIDRNPDSPQSPVVLVVADLQGKLLPQGHFVDLSSASAPNIRQGIAATAASFDVSPFFVQ